jgi:uncharacterized integral membrane protein (TIGR00697 family)
VFGVSVRIIIGSLTAYLVGQLVDISVFHFVRKRTGRRLLWRRATSTTVVSQLIDSFIVLFIAFLGQLTVMQIVSVGLTNYVYKSLIALATTPLPYLIQAIVDRYLGRNLVKEMMDQAHPQRTDPPDGM